MNLWKENEASKALLGSGLINSDSHDEEGALMTVDGMFYFVPHLDEPVMSSPRIGKNSEPTGFFKWSIEIGVHQSNYPNEPDDWDIAEVDGRHDSLTKAIECAAHMLLDNEIAGKLEEIFWRHEETRTNIEL